MFLVSFVYGMDFLSESIKIVASYYVAVLEYFALLLPPAGIIGLVIHLLDGPVTFFIRLAGWVIIAALALLLIWGSRNAWSPIVRTYTLTIDKKVSGRDSMTVMVASDIHLGDIVGNRHLSKLVRLKDELKPDLILLPGDIIDDSVKPFIRHNMAATIAKLQAPLGTYAILGNHEYYGGHIPDYTSRMKAVGIPVLAG